MIDSRFDEITGDVSFVVAPAFGRPAMVPAAGIAQGISRLQIAIGLLCRKDDGYPPFEGRLHFILCADDLRVTFRVDHKRFAHRFHGLMYPRIGEDISLMVAMGFAF